MASTEALTQALPGATDTNRKNLGQLTAMSCLRIKLDTSQYNTGLKCRRHLQIFLVSTVHSSEAVTFGWENVFINIEVPHEAVSTAVHVLQQGVCRRTNLLQRLDLQHTETNTSHQWS